MACRTEKLKQYQVDLLVQCQQMRLSQAQTDASSAASAESKAAHELDWVRTAFREHVGRMDRESKRRYADLHHAMIDIQHLSSLRAGEHEAAQEVKLRVTELECLQRQADEATKLRIAAEQEQFTRARRMAKLEELLRETNARVQAANMRLEHSKEDEIPLRQRQG